MTREGTGKTFVYVKSILEMNRKYGFTKFIIIVPSIAIKEGVFKTLEMTEEYFKSTMNGIVYNSFMYDSKKLNEVENFARNNTIEIMIINIQSFSRKGRDTDDGNIIYRDDMDSLFGNRPIDLIAQTNPVVIIDEPQSVDNTTNSQESIKALNPSIAFRFSATHKRQFPTLYKLGPVEAYQKQLVKQIEVASFRDDVDPNVPHFRLVSTRSTKTILDAQVEMNVQTRSGLVRKIVRLKKDDELYNKSGKLEAYDSLGFVRNISAEEGNEYIEISGGEEYYTLEESLITDLNFKRAQIRETIKAHLDKEVQLQGQGIKVLSLFFIDKVANYLDYDEESNELKGIYAQIFEEEYESLIRSPKYKNLNNKEIPVEEVHDGYFSIKGRRAFDSGGNSADDETTYQIIMKDKEDLLTLYDSKKGKTKKANKLRFIFSHSALREGWDNPNVFQICTLVETKDDLTKRQKIGRGLRIAVNQEGIRVPGFDVNTLTVMANESYDEFVDGLQREYKDEGIQFGIFEEDMFSSIILEREITGHAIPLGNENSKILFNFLKKKDYLDKDSRGTEKLAVDIKENNFDLPEEILKLGKEIEEKVIEIIENKFNVEKVKVRNYRKRVEVKLNKEALSGPFIELWEKISKKTRYKIQFDSEEFIEEVSEALKNEMRVSRPRRKLEKNILGVGESGITSVEEESSDYENTITEYNKAPDLLTFLQNDTKLTRKTIIKILKKSETLREFKRNPQGYMMEASRIINSRKQTKMVDGIIYEKIGKSYEQSLLDFGEMEQYEDNTLISLNDKYPYNRVIVDSEIEKNFAKECEKDENIKFYIKLPHNFKVPTPLGDYNPDWAILIEKDGRDRLYFIVETKSTLDHQNFRIRELEKIKCGKKHFDAIDTGVSFEVATDLNDIYNSVE